MDMDKSGHPAPPRFMHVRVSDLVFRLPRLWRALWPGHLPVHLPGMTLNHSRVICQVICQNQSVDHYAINTAQVGQRADQQSVHKS